MMKAGWRLSITVAALAFALVGCAQPARVEQMAAVPTTALPSGSALHDAVQVENISGGSSTNPLWVSKVGNPEFQSALQESLKNTGMLANGTAHYRLNATLVSLDQPILGFDLTVRTAVQYQLTDVATNKVVFDRPVNAEFTAHVSDAFVAVERLRLANEGAIKTNIRMFLDQLISALGGGVPVSQIESARPPAG